jgi:putative salt-induced outer membrane protein
MNTKLLAAAAAFLAFAGMANAQAGAWIGEGSFGAGVSTGNTETTDVALGVKLARAGEVWRPSVEAIADYSETEGAETRNRVFVAGQLDRDFNARTYGFGRVSHERDEFSGFESRSFVGAGVGYRVLVGEVTTWALEVAPGLKIDETRDITAPVLIPGQTEEGFAVIGASKFAHAFNDNVKLTNDTSAIYAETSTQFTNSLAITSALSGALSARFSFDVRYDTEPPLGFEQTDTITRVSLVYAFGK